MSRPPLRRCPRCWHLHRAWRPETWCRKCMKHTADDRADVAADRRALRAELAARRLARRGEQDGGR